MFLSQSAFKFPRVALKISISSAAFSLVVFVNAIFFAKAFCFFHAEKDETKCEDYVSRMRCA